MTASMRRLDSAADRLYDIAEDVLKNAHESVREMEWDPVEEEPLLETKSWVKHYRRWQATGEHPFFLLRPGLELQAAFGDHALSALSQTLERWGEEGYEYGPELDPRLIESAKEVMKQYWQIRQAEGGPGSANVATWHPAHRRNPS